MASMRNGDTFVDIGANEGMISLLGSHLVGAQGKVLAFEPNQNPRKIFQSAIARNSISNIQIMPIGLGQFDQTLLLNVPKLNSGEGSFGTPDYPPENVDIVECQVKVGDDILGTEVPRLIKIDVEGFELYVLKGLEKTINRAHQSILLEMTCQPAQNAATSRTVLSRCLYQ